MRQTKRLSRLTWAPAGHLGAAGEVVFVLFVVSLFVVAILRRYVFVRFMTFSTQPANVTLFISVNKLAVSSEVTVFTVSCVSTGNLKLTSKSLRVQKFEERLHE